MWVEKCFLQLIDTLLNMGKVDLYHASPSSELRRVPELVRLLVNPHIKLSAVILLAAGSAKAIDIVVRPQEFGGLNPLLPISNYGVTLIVASVEICIGLFLLISRRIVTKAAVIAYIGCVFCGYRAALAVIGYHGRCGCLGSAGRLWLSERLESTILLSVAVVMAIGGVLTLLAYKSGRYGAIEWKEQ